MKKLLLGIANSSVLWGLAATFVFYFALDAGLIQSETLVRYCAGHPVEYATTAMFWIGFCDLTFKLWRASKERRGLKRGLLFPPKKTTAKESTENVDNYLKTLEKARAVRGDSTYLRRLDDALSFLKFGGSPDDLDQELRFLADDDADRRESQYGLVKTFVWAIPILGFLGTVLGITTALGSLDLTQLEATGDMLAAGLKIAFDTTALALTLVFVLYFFLFFVRNRESELADAVSRLVDAELKGRFVDESERDGAKEAEFETTRQMLGSIAASFEEMTRTQTALWTDAMTNVAKKSAELSNDAAARLDDALVSALQNGAASWSNALAETQRRFVEETIRPALEETAAKTRRLDALEEKIAQETEALGAVLNACADVATLEDRLTRTLERIAQVGDFEKTLNNLSATVCLLNSKLTATPLTASAPSTISAISALAKAAAANVADENQNAPDATRQESFAALDELENAVADAANETSDERPRKLLKKKRSA